jgi:hypothetical protein
MPFAIERRRAGRVACRLPIRLLRGSEQVLAATEDLSLCGVRVRVPLAALKVPADAGLGSAARRLHELLGDAFVAEFAWPTHGSLVRRVLRVARLGVPTDAPGHVDLGCEVRVPLGDVETQALGLDLPALREPPAAPREDGRGHVLIARAVLMPPRAPGRVPAKAHLRHVSPEELTLALPRNARPGAPPDGSEATASMIDFEDRFGALPHLLVMGMDEPLWSGTARVSSVEVLRGEDMVRICMRPDEPLRSDELERLGIGVGI